MVAMSLPDKPPSSTEELASSRGLLGDEVRALARELMKLEFELMQARQASDLSAVVRGVSDRLDAAARSWADLSRAMRRSWQL